MNNNLYGMNELYVGQRLERFKGDGDYIMVDIADDGIHVFVFLKNITDHELAQFKSKKPYKICLTELNDLIFFLMQFGDLDWMDAPYDVHFSRLTGGNLPPITNDNQRYRVYLCVGDSATGKIMHLRGMTLENREAKILHHLIEEQRDNIRLKMPLYYDAALEDVYRGLTTWDMLKYIL